MMQLKFVLRNIPEPEYIYIYNPVEVLGKWMERNSEKHNTLAILGPWFRIKANFLCLT